MKKFFFISQVFYPDEVSTASLFTDLSLELVKNDIEVCVWCAQPSYTTNQRQPKNINYKGINIKYILSTNFQKDNFFGRIINYVSFSFFLFLNLLFDKDKTPIYTVTNPPFLGVLVSLCCKLRNRKFIYIVSDVYPDGIIRLGKISEKNVISFIWKKVNKYVLKSSSKIIVLGRDMIEWVKLTSLDSVCKIEYIPHWHDEDLFKPIQFHENPFVKEHDLYNKFVVQYSGNMGLWHDMKSFAIAARELQDHGINFVFIGNGIRRKELFEEWKDSIPNNSKVLSYQPKEKLGESLTACHVALISLRNNLEGMAVPSKLYGILASGVPIVAMVPPTSEIALVVNEEKCGFVVEPGNVEELMNRLIELKLDEQKRVSMGKNARLAFESKYTTKIISKKYIDLLSKLE